MPIISDPYSSLRPTTVSRETLLSITAAIIGVATSFIPWPGIILEISGSPMWDRQVYIDTIESGRALLDAIKYDNLISYFTFEFLWAILLQFVSTSPYLHYETFFQIIAALSLSAFSVILVRRTHLAALILLLNPLVIDLIYSQLRMSLAISLLMWLSILRVRWYLFVPLAVVATMIHTAMLVFIAAHFVALMTAPGARQHNLSAPARMTILVLFGFSIGVMVGPLREIILSTLGDRRAEYPETSSSLVYLAYWILLFIALVMDRGRTLRSYESRYAVAILGIIVINAFTGFYSARFLSAIFPFLLISILNVFGKHNFIMSFPFIGYFAFQWFYYINNMTS